jgi:hypothetical protein
MSTWKTLCGVAVFALALAPSAHADDYTKLTLLTFSAPVDVPGITLPAGTYRFALADPESGRRAIKVTDKDGTKIFGTFLSIPNQRMTPSDKPVVMFKEAAAGAPPAVQVWFYPSESYGYEFIYPHDQALKIAKATHQPVLAQTGTDVARIDEHDKPVSTDEVLKDSSEPRRPVATPAATTASVGTSGTASSTAAPAPMASTSGNTAPSQAATASKPVRRHLPRTASPLPLLMLLGGLSFAGAFGVRAVRQMQ